MKVFRAVSCLSLCVLTVAAFASPPTELDYQGKILISDVPLTGPGYFKYAISSEDGLTNFWSNSGTTAGEPTGFLTNDCFNGVFSTILGGAPMANIDPAIFALDTSLYLRVWFSSDKITFNEMLPAQDLLSSPFAINADMVDGLDAGDLIARATNGVTLSGDVSGTPGAGTTVDRLQGDALNVGTPSAGEGLVWNGTAWSNAAGGISGAVASNSFVKIAGDTMTGVLDINSPRGLKIGSASNEVEIGNSANGAGGGTAVGRLADGAVSGAAVGNLANANSYGAALGAMASATNGGVAVGWQAIGVNNGVAVGYGANASSLGAAVGRQANGASSGAAVGRGANGSGNGSAVGVSAVGTNDGAALGRLANGSSDGAAVGVGADGSDSGVAVGRSAKGFTTGVAIGYDARGTNGGAAVGFNANGSDSGAALGDVANGWYSGVAVGHWASGWSNGVAVGNQSKGSGWGVGVGNTANGVNYGTAVGYSSDGNNHGTAVGEQSVGFDYGVAAGYQAYGNNSGVGIGQGADGKGTNVAIGVSAFAGSGSERIAIGHNVNNSVDESARIRGTLYMDGGTALVARSTFGVGVWQTLVPLPPLDNVVFVATNGTPAGPGTIDRPYDSPQNGYSAAALRYTNSPAAIVISAGKYTGLTMTRGNIHVLGQSRPQLAWLMVNSGSAFIQGKQRVENLVVEGTAAVTADMGSNVKFHNCRFNGGLAIHGPRVEVQDCHATGKDGPAVTVGNAASLIGEIAIYNSSLFNKDSANAALLVNAQVRYFEVIGCEIVNYPPTMGGIPWAAIADLESQDLTPPQVPHLYSHNVIQGAEHGTWMGISRPAVWDPNVTNGPTITFLQNSVWGDVGMNSNRQFFANNTVYGDINNTGMGMFWGWSQFGLGTGLDAAGNTEHQGRFPGGGGSQRGFPAAWQD